MNASEQYARTKYPFLDMSIILIPQIMQNADYYDPTSCSTISRICLSGMKTTDILITNETLQHVPVLRLLGDLWQMFWGGWVSFAEFANTSTGTNQLGITSESVAILNQFTNWDEALSANPFQDIAASFYSLLKGVSP